MFLRTGYEFIFYKLYRWSQKVTFFERNYLFHTCLMQTVLFGVHSYTILVLLEVEKFDVSAFSQNFMIFAATVFFVLNYAYFSRHGRLKKILARYESSSQKVGWFVPVYVVIAIAVFLAAVAFKDYRP